MTVKEYIVKVIGWLTSHCDIELDPITEYEVIRVLIDVAEEENEIS